VRVSARQPCRADVTDLRGFLLRTRACSEALGGGI
jgi:hypothetical protein